MKFKSLLALLLATTICYDASAAITVDGPASSTTTVGSTLTGSITTANTNDVIVLFAAHSSGSPAHVTGITDAPGGLTWTKRVSCAASSDTTVEEWYAVSTGALTSDLITVTYSATPTARIWYAGFTGANTTTPFDPNVSLPGSSCLASGTSNTITYSTTTANDMLVSLQKVATAFTALTPPAGTQIAGPFTSAAAFYDLLSGTASGAANAYSWTGGSQVNGQVLDALQPAGSPPPPPPPAVPATGLLNTQF